jgi:hypothetical protein
MANQTYWFGWKLIFQYRRFWPILSKKEA